MANAMYEWVVTDSKPYTGWQNVAGPVVLLIGLGLSVLGNWLWGGMIGDVSCRYRLSYSPYNQAFGIWLVIYPWFFASVLFQFLHSFDSTTFYVTGFASNLLMCVSWASSGAWTFFFGTGDSPNPAVGLGLATFFLLLAALTAMSAVFVEQGFRPDASVTRILTVSVPFSLYAGWLAVAASINVGIFVTVQTINGTDMIGLCERPPTNSQPVIPDPRGWADASIPLVLAIIISTIAISQSDFVTVIPILWAVYWMKRDALKIIAMAAAALGFLISVGLFLQHRLGR